MTAQRAMIPRAISRLRHPTDDRRLGYLLNLPALAALLLVVGIPIAQTFVYSLHVYRLAPPTYEFAGLQNYITALTSPPLLDALRFTLIFAVVSVPLIVLTGLAGALILNEVFPGRPLVRAFVVIPWAIPGVVNGALWVFIFNSKYGLLNGILYTFGVIPKYQSWLLDPVTAIPALIVANIWTEVPVAIIVFLAALQAIPADMYEAAKVDRANIWRRFRHVTLPWLQHAILIVLILQTIHAVRIYDIIYVLTGGGPGSATTTIAWLARETTFYDLNFGLGSTYSFIMALITLGIAIVYFRLLYSRGEIRV